MIKIPIESQDQILQSTQPALSVIPMLLSATSHAMQNSQTLQQFLSPLYMVFEVDVLQQREGKGEGQPNQPSGENSDKTPWVWD